MRWGCHLDAEDESQQVRLWRPSRHFPCAQQSGRFQVKADIKRQADRVDRSRMTHNRPIGRHP